MNSLICHVVRGGVQRCGVTMCGQARARPRRMAAKWKRRSTAGLAASAAAHGQILVGLRLGCLGGWATMAAYDMMGAGYQRHTGDSAYNAHYDRPAVLAALGPVSGHRVLDAACGPGICGCWSPQTRSCAGTATSSGAARPPGRCAARPGPGTVSPSRPAGYPRVRNTRNGKAAPANPPPCPAPRRARRLPGCWRRHRPNGEMWRSAAVQGGPGDRSLYRAAKADPGRRFHALYDNGR